MGWEKLFGFAVYVEVWKGEVKLTIIVRWGWTLFGALLQSNWSVMALVGMNFWAGDCAFETHLVICYPIG